MPDQPTVPPPADVDPEDFKLRTEMFGARVRRAFAYVPEGATIEEQIEELHASVSGIHEIVFRLILSITDDPIEALESGEEMILEVEKRRGILSDEDA
jgi:hypothetical protein